MSKYGVDEDYKNPDFVNNDEKNGATDDSATPYKKGNEKRNKEDFPLFSGCRKKVRLYLTV